MIISIKMHVVKKLETSLWCIVDFDYSSWNRLHNGYVKFYFNDRGNSLLAYEKRF